MNHSKHRTEGLGGTKVPGMLIALCTMGLVAAIDAQRPATAGDVRTAKVSVADLDLGTTAGMMAAQARVRQMARRLCSQVEHLDDLSHYENYLACVDASVTAAMQQLKGPALAGLAAKNAGNTP
jgi:UrcA family protein